MLQSSLFISTKTGSKPAFTIASDVAKKENDGTITSFFFSSSASRPISNASVPFPTLTTYSIFKNFENFLQIQQHFFHQ